MTHVETNGRKKRLLKQQSSGYKPLIHTWGTHERDLPPFTFRTVQAMLLDPAVRLGLAMRAAPIYGVEFAHKVGENWVPGIVAESKEVGSFVTRQLRRIWDQVEQILSAQIWGWSSGEVTYRLHGGLVEVDQLLARHANDTLVRVSEGKVVGVQVRRVMSRTGGAVDLSFPKCWWHAYEPEPGMFYGRPVLLGCYSPFWDKWMNGGALDVRRLFMHKDAYGGTDMTYPEGTTYVPDKGEVPNRDIAREIAEQIVAGGVTARPAAYDERGNELWQLTRATVPATPQHILDYPKDLDVEIWRGMGIADDVLSSQDTGAWAGKRVPMAAFYASLDRWVLAIIHDLVTQILEPLVELNFGRRSEFEVTHKPLAEQAMEQQGETQGGQQPAGQGQAAGPPMQRMGLDPVKAVGEGVLSAAELVKAARRVLRMAGEHARAPKGGITIAGKHFRAGQFIPSEILEQATDEQKAAIRGEDAGGGEKTEPAEADEPTIPDVRFRKAEPHAFIDAVRKVSQRWKPFLTPHTEESVQRIIDEGGTVHLAEDGKSGYILTADGDLQNVFNAGSPKGAGKAAIIDAIANGARTLDCFEGYLSSLYAAFGFVAYQAEQFDEQYAPADWPFDTEGRPDVVFMQYEGGTRDVEEIRRAIGQHPPFVNPADVVGYGKRLTGFQSREIRSRTPRQKRRRMGRPAQGDAGRSVGVHRQPLTGRSSPPRKEVDDA